MTERAEVAARTPLELPLRLDRDLPWQVKNARGQIIAQCYDNEIAATVVALANADLHATVAALRKALEPFAKAFAELPSGLTATDEFDECCVNLAAPYALEPITIGDVRRAALALRDPAGKET